MMKHMMCKIHFLRSEKADSHGSRVTQDVSLSFTGMWVAESSNTSLKSDIKYKYIFYVNIHEKSYIALLPFEAHLHCILPTEVYSFSFFGVSLAIC